MKLQISPQALVDGLNLASGASAGRTPKEALQCVLMKASDKALLLMATDLEVGVRCQLAQVDIQKGGEALVSAAKISQVARELTDEVVSLELRENQLHLRGRGVHFQMVSRDPKEFPPVPDLEGEPDFEIEARELRRMAERTAFAAARESTRYAIDGLLWERKGDQLMIVATDGRRLAVASCSVTPKGGASTQKDARVIVPAKTMQLISRVVESSEERLGVKFLPNQLLLKTEHVTISSVLVEGHFPKYEDVVPQDCDKRATVRVQDMHHAVRRAALMTSEESKGVRLCFSAGKLVLSSRSAEQGEASIELAVRYEGETLDIGFNPSFLSDFLKVLEEEEVTFELKEPNRPMVCHCGENYTYVVMPVNLS